MTESRSITDTFPPSNVNDLLNALEGVLAVCGRRRVGWPEVKVTVAKNHTRVYPLADDDDVAAVKLARELIKRWGR